MDVLDFIKQSVEKYGGDTSNPVPMGPKAETSKISNGRGHQSYAREDYLRGTGGIPAVSVPKPTSQPDVLGETLGNLGLLKTGYDTAETEYKAAQDAYTKAMQNAPADVDFDTYLKPYRDRASAAEAALRSSRQNYEQAGGEIKKTNWGNLLSNRNDAGWTSALLGTMKGADFLVGDFVDEGRVLADQTLRGISGGKWGLDLEKGSLLDRAIAERQAHLDALNRGNEQNIGENDKTAQAVSKYMPTVVQAIPQAVLALMTMGGSAGAQASSAALQQTALLADSSGAAQVLIPAAKAFAAQLKDPQWGMSFISTVGNDYEEALSEGASQAQAAIYALLTSGTNATIEVGGGDEALGGLQKLPKSWRQAIQAGDNNALLQLVKSAGSEVLEEIEQGITSETMKGSYRDVSANEIFDPERMKEEAKGAFITSLFLGGGQMATTNAIESAAQRRSRSGQQVLDLVQPTQATTATAPAEPQTTTPAAEAMPAQQNAAETPAESAQPVAPETVPAGAQTAQSAPAPELKQAESKTERRNARLEEIRNRLDEISDDNEETRALEKEYDQLMRESALDRNSNLFNSAFALTDAMENAGFKMDENGRFTYNGKKVGLRLESLISDLVHDRSIDARSVAQAMATMAERGGNMPVADLVSLAYEIDGTQMPEWVRSTYAPTEADIHSNAENNARYYNGQASYFEALQKKAIKAGDAEYAEKMGKRAAEYRAKAKEANRLAAETKSSQQAKPTESPAVEESAPVDTQGTPAAETSDNGENVPNEYIPPVNEGAKPREVESQSHSIEGQMNAYGQDYEAPKHITKPEIESLTNAINRASSDMNGETQRLLTKDSWTGEDIDTAMVINGKLLIDAIKNNDFSASDAWLKVLEQHKQEAGRSLQALSKWARGGKAAVQEANTMLAEAKDVSTEQRAATLNQVQNYADRFDAIQDGDLDSLRKLILEMNEDRGTGTIIKGNFERFLNKETDFDYLKEFALRQLMAIPGDVTNKADLGQRLKTWQSLAQLLRITTTRRNVLGNESFGLIDLIPQSSVGWLLDSLVGAIDGTGVHTVGPDASWLNSNARKAMGRAINRSMMEIAADVYMGGENAYSTQGLRTNKASGNVFERLLSRAEQLSGYALSTTDVAASERQATSYVDMLNRMNNGKLTPEQMQELARNITDYRLFKNKGVARTLSQGAHDVMNLLGIGGEVQNGMRRGGFGLAEIVGFNYPGVPANLGVKVLEYSPLNAAKGLYELVKYGIDTKNNGAPDLVARQNAVMDFSRGVTGTALIAACAQLFASGILRYYDDEDDYDVITQNKAEGKTGTLINISALGRMLSGGDPEWQETDKVMNIAYLQPINSLFAISHYISKDFKDGGVTLGSLAGDFWRGSWNGLLDMPVMQSIASVADIIGTKYDEETGGSKLFDTAATVASNAVTGMIPGALSQTAKAFDTFERDTSGDSVIERTINTAKKSIPGLRETLPVKYDSFGNPIQYDESTYDRVMNALVRPGTISTIRQSETSKLIENLIAQTGDKNVMPDARAPYKVKIGGEDLALTAEERRAFHKDSGQAVSKYISEQMDVEAFKRATPETQAEVVKDLESYAKDRAKAAFAEKRGLEYTSDYQKLLDGKDAPGTGNDVPALKEKNAGEYISFNSAYSTAQKDADYNVIDDLLKQYPKLDNNTKDVLTAKNPKDLKNLLAFGNAGSGSESYYKIKEAIGDAQWDLDANSAQGSHVRMAGLADANVSTAEKDKLVESEAFKLSGTAKSTYGILRGFGMQPGDISQWFENADWYASGTGKEPKADGSLNAYEVATAISKIPNLSDQQREAMYRQFKQAIQRPNDAYDTWKEKSYTQALRQSTSYGRITGRGESMPGAAQTSPTQDQNVLDYLLSLGRAN